MTKITRIEVEDNDITFFFSDSDHPWGSVEFNPNSKTSKALFIIEDEIQWFNEQQEARND